MATTLTLIPATFTEAGVAAGLTATRLLAAAYQTFTLAGQDIALPYGQGDILHYYTLVADCRAFIMAGSATGLQFSGQENVMAVITLAVQEAARAGTIPARTAAGASPLLNTTDSFTFNNSGREVLLFMKSGAANCNVVLDIPITVDGQAVTDRTVAVLASTGDKIIGPFSPSIYNTPGTSMLSGFTVSEVTGLTVAVIRVA